MRFCFLEEVEDFLGFFDEIWDLGGDEIGMFDVFIENEMFIESIDGGGEGVKELGGDIVEEGWCRFCWSVIRWVEGFDVVRGLVVDSDDSIYSWVNVVVEFL